MKKNVEKKLVTVFATVLMVATMAGTACAVDPIKHKSTWLVTGACVGCDLTKIKSPAPNPQTRPIATPTQFGIPTVYNAAVGLEAASLHESVFAPNMNLSNYNLKKAYFNSATLNGANLSGANVTGTTFTGTKFGAANLTNIKVDVGGGAPNFSGADFSLVAAANRPSAWPANASLGGATWVTGIKCDSTVESTGGCYNKSKCPPSNTATGNSGYLNNDGSCKQK